MPANTFIEWWKMFISKDTFILKVGRIFKIKYLVLKYFKVLVPSFWHWCHKILMPHVQIARKTLATCPPRCQGRCHNFGVFVGHRSPSAVIFGIFLCSGPKYQILVFGHFDFGHKSTQKPWPMPQLWYFTLATSPRICGTSTKMTVAIQIGVLELR